MLVWTHERDGLLNLHLVRVQQQFYLTSHDYHRVYFDGYFLHYNQQNELNFELIHPLIKLPPTWVAYQPRPPDFATVCYDQLLGCSYFLPSSLALFPSVTSFIHHHLHLNLPTLPYFNRQIHYLYILNPLPSPKAQLFSPKIIVDNISHLDAPISMCLSGSWRNRYHHRCSYKASMVMVKVLLSLI